MDDSENTPPMALQSLLYWVYTIQYILWIVHDIKIYVYVMDCELTVELPPVELHIPGN